jgi:hypothetical protein
MQIKTIRDEECRKPTDCTIIECEFNHQSTSGKSQVAERILNGAARVGINLFSLQAQE